MLFGASVSSALDMNCKDEEEDDIQDCFAVHPEETEDTPQLRAFRPQRLQPFNNPPVPSESRVSDITHPKVYLADDVEVKPARTSPITVKTEEADCYHDLTCGHRIQAALVSLLVRLLQRL
jgi:hypothetical protein